VREVTVFVHAFSLRAFPASVYRRLQAVTYSANLKSRKMSRKSGELLEYLTSFMYIVLCHRDIVLCNIYITETGTYIFLVIPNYIMTNISYINNVTTMNKSTARSLTRGVCK
jgi:hypothetical protein